MNLKRGTLHGAEYRSQETESNFQLTANFYIPYSLSKAPSSLRDLQLNYNPSTHQTLSTRT